MRYLSLDVLKAISIILIILTHVNVTDAQRSELLYNFWVYPAVPIFMVISAFNYTERGVESWFSSGVFLKRCGRLLIPYVIVFAIEIIRSVYLNGKIGSAISIISSFLCGGGGPGGYYIAMLFQLLVIFPVVYSLLKPQESRLKNTCGLILFCLLYEIGANTIPLTGQFYRICLFRLLLAVVLGILLSMYKERISGSAIPVICFIMGAIYLFMVTCAGYTPKIVNSWLPTSMFAIPYSVAIVYWFYKKENFFTRHQRNIVVVVLAFIGRATYFIFLSQKVYFIFSFSKKFLSSTSLPCSVAFDAAVCLIAGCIFYLLYSKIKSLV